MRFYLFHSTRAIDFGIRYVKATSQFPPELTIAILFWTFNFIFGNNDGIISADADDLSYWERT